MTEPKRLARVAGFLYLLVAAFTIFAGVVNTRVAASGAAGRTADASTPRPRCTASDS
ncbi:hypothetical protein [Nocardiopsis sp. CNR-923]|uniref:hypothetical protein n=1 Tax=Nocardiopsis sp. CNR-923 TaxID=1904965 RepID=UPI000AC4AB73|nr:hypothetical protein [Nocardiopsis sp. CNR-923]